MRVVRVEALEDKTRTLTLFLSRQSIILCYWSSSSVGTAILEIIYLLLSERRLLYVRQATRSTFAISEKSRHWIIGYSDFLIKGNSELADDYGDDVPAGIYGRIDAGGVEVVDEVAAAIAASSWI